MTRPPEGDPQRDEAELRRRCAAVFGEVLPEEAADERDERWGEPGTTGHGDEWLRREVPPHHL